MSKPPTQQNASIIGSIIVVWLSLLLVLGLTLRPLGLNNGPYWFDELIGVEAAKDSWPAFVDYVRSDAHPPLYYLGIRALYLAGSELPEQTTRLASVLIGFVSIFSVWLVGRAMGGKFIGFAATALAAASPLFIFYSREARMYAPMILFSILSLGSFWLWLQSNQRRWLVTFLLASVLGLLTHYSFALLMVAQAIFLLFERRYRRIKVSSNILLLALAALPAAAWKMYQLIPKIIEQPLQLPVWYTSLNPDHWSANRLIQELLFSQYTPWTSMSSLLGELYLLLFPVVVAAFLGLLGFVVYRFFKKRTESGPRQSLIRYLLCVAVLTYLTSFITKVDVTKYYIPGACAVLLLLAIGVEHVRYRRIGVVALGIICVSSAIWIPSMIKGQRYPWDKAAQYIESHERPGDAVFVHNWVNTLSLNHQYRGNAPVVGINPIPLDTDVSELAAMNEIAAAQVVNKDNIDTWMRSTTAPYARIWLVVENTAPFFGEPLIRQWLLENGWAIISVPEVDYANPGFLTLYARYVEPK